MSFDFTEIDAVIETLQKKNIGGGSPPVVERGHMGIWRTVRGFRMFLELVPGTGKWAVDVEGKPHVQGKVLVGPPSLVNQPIGGVGDSVWGALSGSGMKANFPSASPEGLKTLRESVGNSLKDDDTRQAQLEGAPQPKLVQIARSAGFTDGEIKDALGGKVFEDAIGNNVVPFARPKKPKPDAPDVEAPKAKPSTDTDDKVTQLRPTPPKGDDKPEPSGGQMTADGSLAPLIEALQNPDSDGDDARIEAAEKVEQAAENLAEEFLRRQVRALADGLRSGDFSVADVRAEVLALVEHRQGKLTGNLDEEKMDKLSDKAAAKDAVSKIKAHVAQVPANATAEQLAANAQWYHDQLVDLSKRVNNPEVKRQLVVLAKKIKAGRIGGNSVVLRVLAILRLILAFIPG